MRIDRCVCFQKTFSELKAVAEATGATTVEALQHHVRFGLNCRLCVPYVREMLASGLTSFDHIITSGETQD
jgi:bacterioferritin-associated ferredoxin